MCGIAGIVDYDGQVDRGALAAMTAALRHRGPDDCGYHLDDRENRGPSVGLGFRRLAIIDVEGGRQPLTNEDGSIALVFNGEVYNFGELRAELVARGHALRTRTDAEVVVHLYEELGPACLERLNGMFAFALWDARRRRMFLARDRLGEKPLYYAALGKRFLFASELKALVRHPDCPRRVDEEALELYLAMEYVPSPWTILAGVRKLPAGHFALVDDGRLSVEQYWDLSFARGEERDDQEWVDEFRTRLSESVRMRLVSDVPLGVFLSGGIDSSSVAALAAEHLGASSVSTFSVGFAEKSFDEAGHARHVAHAFGFDHHEQTFTPEVMLETLPQVLSTLDEPFADPSLLPTYLLSRFARERVTVALGGDGGDELLAGYPTFQAEVAARFYRLPRRFHERVVMPLADRLPVSTANFSLDFKLKRFLRGARQPPASRHAAWLGAFTPHALRSVLASSTGTLDDPYAVPARLFDRYPDAAPLERLVYQYAKSYLQDDILVKVDRASMLASLEVRAPFLDHTLVEFLGRVPPRLKLRGLTSKYLLKRAMAGTLPADILQRPKKGFGIPLAAWLRDELREHLREELAPERLRAQGIFRPSAVDQLVRDHLAGQRDNRKELWTLLVFQHWHRALLAGGPETGRARERVDVPLPSLATGS